MQILLDLPLEILCQALGELGAGDLLAVRKTCQVLKQSIDNSEALQYILDLQYYQMISVCAAVSKLPAAARRKRLNASSLQILEGKFTAEKPEIDVTWMHSTSEWNVIDFTFSPAHDLLVIVAGSSGLDHHVYDVHIRSLSTNEPHSMADQTTLQALRKDILAPDAAEFERPVELRTHGDYVGTLCLQTCLQVWNWKQNEYEFMMQFPLGAHDFVFLSDDTFLILNVEGHFELYSYGGFNREPRVIGMYALPELKEDWYYSFTFASFNPSPSHNFSLPNGVPYGFSPSFYPKLEDQILVFNILSLLNLKQIMNGIRPNCSIIAEPVPWLLWGPKYTRCFSKGHMDWAQGSAFGYRTIEIIDESPGISSLMHNRDSSTGSDGCCLGRLVPSAPTTSPRHPFTEPLGSALAYREVISEEKFEASDVLMDGSTVLLFLRENDLEFGVDILMF
ncbi:hypothetical protein BJ138DRAFT_1127352 [Hygrophoropsis aurantiaca]|uniref:Uncharacterized protein n=1 Tax=Hygrophoropsis aurantiaca TaxID=72124 RepID=A0ACB8A8S3_9AGAM|nr:hypothetical protein BJ138DRAFT_1127352 [Hygrophoropsis aurantiaca]